MCRNTWATSSCSCAFRACRSPVCVHSFTVITGCCSSHQPDASVGHTTRSSQRASRRPHCDVGAHGSVSVSTEAHSQARAVSQKESSHPQRMAGFCSQILRVCPVIHLQGPAEAQNDISVCRQHFTRYWICWILAMPGQSILPSSLDLSQSCLSFWAFLQVSQLCRSFDKWAGVAHPNEEYFDSKIQKGSLGVVSPLWLQGNQIQQLILQLSRDVSHTTGSQTFH